MLARILSGGTPIEEGNDAFPIDWLLLLASTAGQAPTGLAIVAALMRIQVAKWAKGPYVGGEPTDFFTGWNDALFEARFCYKKKGHEAAAPLARDPRHCVSRATAGP